MASLDHNELKFQCWYIHLIWHQHLRVKISTKTQIFCRGILGPDLALTYLWSRVIMRLSFWHREDNESDLRMPHKLMCSQSIICMRCPCFSGLPLTCFLCVIVLSYASCWQPEKLKSKDYNKNMSCNIGFQHWQKSQHCKQTPWKIFYLTKWTEWKHTWECFWHDAIHVAIPLIISNSTHLFLYNHVCAELLFERQ